MLDGLAEEEGLIDLDAEEDGEMDGLTLVLGLILALAEEDGLIDADTLALGDILADSAAASDKAMSNEPDPLSLRLMSNAIEVFSF